MCAYKRSPISKTVITQGPRGVEHTDDRLHANVSRLQDGRDWTWQVGPMDFLAIDTYIFNKEKHHRQRYRYNCSQQSKLAELSRLSTVTGIMVGPSSPI